MRSLNRSARCILCAIASIAFLSIANVAHAGLEIDSDDNAFTAAARALLNESSGPSKGKGSRSNPITRSWKRIDRVTNPCSADPTQAGSCFFPVAACSGQNAADAATGGDAAWTAQSGTETDRRTGASSNLGFRCVDVNGNPVTPDGAPIVITVTQQDFASLPVQPAVAHAGPSVGYLPVGMDLIVYAEATEQTLDTTLLATPVRVRATPVRYHWDFGDGNSLDTSKAGRPYPSRDVTSQYAHEGWYDITLTTTYSGQFSVNGGAWQDIDGTITVDSEPVAIYSRSFESHLIDPSTAPDDAGTLELPPRTPDTEGPRAESPRHRTV